MESVEEVYNLLKKGRTTKKAIKELGLLDSVSDVRDALVEKYGQLHMDNIIMTYVMPTYKKTMTHALAMAMKVMANPTTIVVSDEVAESRLALCNECDEEEGGRCSLCRCPISNITRLKAYKCKALKWPE